MNLKHLVLFGIFIALFSCNTESTDIPNEEIDDLILLKKVIETDSDGEIYTINYTYDGNKLTTVDYGAGNKNLYTYENEKLVREDQFLDNDLVTYIILDYNPDETLAIYTEYRLEASGMDALAYKHLITYNSDNTWTNKVYTGDYNAQTTLLYTETITFDGKNISKIDVISDDSTTYTYDTKNNMFKNVHALEVLNLLSENEFGALVYGNTNNATSVTYAYSNSVITETYEYSYDTNNYPKTANYTEDYSGAMEFKMSIEYFYE